MHIISTKRNEHLTQRQALNKLNWETTLKGWQYTYQKLLYELVEYLLLKFDTVKHENNQNKEILLYRTPGKTRSH